MFENDTQHLHLKEMCIDSVEKSALHKKSLSPKYFKSSSKTPNPSKNLLNQKKNNMIDLDFTFIQNLHKN